MESDFLAGRRLYERFTCADGAALAWSDIGVRCPESDMLEQVAPSENADAGAGRCRAAQSARAAQVCGR